MDGHSFTQAHYTVLQNSTSVAPYIKEHMNIVRSKNPGQSNSWITHAHIETFRGWLQTHLVNNTTVGDQLYLLARSPSSTILTFQGYEINGSTFYTIA
jgi:serine acetyltransferase